MTSKLILLKHLFPALFLVLFLSQPVKAQDANNDIAQFDWSDFEKYAKKDINLKEDAEATILFQKTTIDIISSPSSVIENYLFCTSIHINSDAGIESNNRIYLPFNYTGRFLVTKARVTNSKGEIIELTSDDIKEAVDEQTKVSYRYFALEGLDVGSVISYFYVLERPAELTGKRVIVQANYDIKDYHFRINSGDHLDLAFKSFNGLKNFVLDTATEAGTKSWDLKVKNMKGFEEEEQATNEANKLAFIYKLEKNSITGKRAIYSYPSAIKFVFRNSYLQEDKSNKKAKARFLKSIKVNENASIGDKVRAIENHIKNNFSFSRYGDNTLGDFNNIIEKKIANTYGYLQLFTTALDKHNIEHQLVMTTNRFNMAFDKDFESYNFLDKFLIYIPGEDKYLAPHQDDFRLGYVPPAFMNNYGLFIEKIKIGNTSSAIGEVKFIEPLSCDATTSQLDINIDFQDDIYASIIDFKATKTGYYTNSFRYYYGQLPVDKQTEILENNLSYYTNNGELIERGVENPEIDLLGVKPLVMKGSFSVEPFIEKAGNKYIIKIGELIGAQMEMYNDIKERRQDIDASFARRYVRNIKFTVPDDYSISNLDEIKIDKSYLKEEKKAMQFKSDYQLTGNTLTVHIDEYYNSPDYPLTLFEPYKEVINAAADFNKVVVFLDKK